MKSLDTFEQVVDKFENFVSGMSGAAKLPNSYDTGDEEIMEYGEYPDRDAGVSQPGELTEMSAEGGTAPSSYFSSGYRTARRPNHMGVDYAIATGTPISVIQPGEYPVQVGLMVMGMVFK